MERRKRQRASRMLVTLLITGLLATPFFVLFAAPPAGATIVVVNGDWTVSGVNNVFDGITFKVDGNITVTSGALLEIRNGGLIFLEDSTHIYSLTIETGGGGDGELILDNSILSTEPNQLSDYLKLDVIVAGALTLRNGAILKHPGTLTASGTATVDVRDSTITGFTNATIESFNLDPDDNDDAPIMTFSGSSRVVIAGSTVSRLYENPLSPGPDFRHNITVQGSASLTIIDSFVGVDFLDSNTTHNVIAAEGTSNVYLYNMTPDLVQSTLAPPSAWVPALVPVGSGSTFYIHRWLDATVVDRFGSAIEGAEIESRVLPTGTLAYYPDNGNANVPGATVLTYLGRTAGDFNRTDFFGRARVPLLTEWINEAAFDPSAPNSIYDGNYRIQARHMGSQATQDIAFSAYPALAEADNSIAVTGSLTDLLWPSPDNTYLWNTPRTIDFDVTVDGNVRVTADVTIEGADLTILQYGPTAGRHYLIIEGEGRLTIRDGALQSNHQLTVFLQDNGQLITERTDVLLNAPDARGLIHSEGGSAVDLRDGTLAGDVEARGASVALRNITLGDSDLVFATTGTSRLWDPVFAGAVNLSLLTDDGNTNTLDIDIRNATFGATLAPSVVFTGTQYAQLTDVTFEAAANWWDDRIFDSAKVGFYWWLTVSAVDPTGSAVTDANITLGRLDPVTLGFSVIPAPGPDDLYGGTYLPAHIEAPTGTIRYRALAQERLASQGWANSTYQANGSIDRDGMTFYAEAEVSVSLGASEAVDLVYWNWPDLSISVADVTFTRVPVQGGPVQVLVEVHNLGMADALPATIQILDNAVLADSIDANVSWGASRIVSLNWTPTFAGLHNVTVQALSQNDTVQNTDFDFRNNVVQMVVDVLTQPDLELRAADHPSVGAVQGRVFTVDVVIHNLGNTAALNFEVGLFLGSVSSENEIGSVTGVSVSGGANVTVPIEASAIPDVGNYSLILLADVNGVIPETSETNNRLEILLQIVPPEGSVFFTLPAEGQNYKEGDQIFVSGVVTTPNGAPIPDMQVTLVLRDQDGTVWDSNVVFTDQSGEFVVGLLIAEEGPPGEWTLLAVAEAETISPATVRIRVAEVVPWYMTKVPFVNLPLWMVLAAVGAFLIVVFAVGAYMRSFGLGRLVECGECGAFIPEASEACPKCGTEFEKEMAKCSSCHAWIPADVKKCPECGVEFTTGKSKAFDVKERVRRQYEGIVNKYRAEAARVLGHRPSEKEFQEWWRRQPTFVTLEVWMKEEEEMRKMGSKPCPRCNSLNSITAKICHRCGTPMSGQATPPGGPPPGPGGPAGGGPLPGPPSEPPVGGAPAPPSEKKAVLKRIVKKPFAKRKTKK
ncbi:MAG: CARDB domain-containing protein [Thermoplasmata archaeon]